MIIAFILLIALVGVIVICNLTISKFSEAYVYDDIEKLPRNKAGVLLGTTKYAVQGGKNLYYKYRLDAAVRLYKADKVDYLILSGDNSELYYNEPQNMKNDLLEAGVPDSVIKLDYAGFRTLDAMVRANAIFGQGKFTVISQEFHNKRAIYIARSKGIDAIGFNAKDVSTGYGLKTTIREWFARVKVFIDLYVINKQPKFLGDKIDIDERQPKYDNSGDSSPPQ